MRGMVNSRLILSAIPLLLLAGCSDSPKPAETPAAAAKPHEPVSGRRAFQYMFPTARAWALDALPLQLTSIDVPQVKSEGGKAGAWEGIFVSTVSGRSKRYTYSVIEGEGNLHQGVFAGPEEGWSGPRGSAMPFLIPSIKFDSDQAYETALAKSKDYVAKNPTKPIVFTLEMSNRFPDLTWRVQWGDSVATSDYSVYVDATTGKFLDKVH